MTPDPRLNAVAIALSAAVTEFGWPTTLTDTQIREAHLALIGWNNQREAS